jgi:hypothetical protein
MALTPCPECKHEVSDKARSCPNCGFYFETNEARSSGRARMGIFAAAGVIVALGAGAGIYAGLHRSSKYAQVEEFRAEQDARGTHDEHVRQRFFRLHKEHPKNPMYIYLWARCVDDANQQLELANRGIHLDPAFSWNYNIQARALANLGRVREAYDAAAKGALVDPANLQLIDKSAVLKTMVDHDLAGQPKPAPNGYTAYEGKEHLDKAFRYKGLFRGLVRSLDRADLQAVERSRLPDHKGPLVEAVRGFTVCANTYADACIRAYVPTDDRFGNTWPRGEKDPSSFRDNQVVAVAGAVIPNGHGENILVADAVGLDAK